ncbi:hypothetical protein FRC17_002406, partial [Serendipita sp. 399]
MLVKLSVNELMLIFARVSAGPHSGVEYDSPLADYSEDASSAIGPVMESSTSLALNSTQDEARNETSIDSGEAQQGIMASTRKDLLGRRRDTITTASKGAQHEDDHDADGEDDEDDEESEEDDDDEEDDEEDEEDEEEPVLKYEKIGSAVADILEKDVASAIAIGDTYF